MLISAHESQLAAMAFDASGTRIATASNKVCDLYAEERNILDRLSFSLSKGTLIRVHNVSDGSRLFEFRRGLRRYVRITELLIKHIVLTFVE